MRRKSTRGAAALALGLLGGVLAALAGGGRPAAAATLIQSCGQRDKPFLQLDSNRVVGNTATGNGTVGIQVSSGATANQILGNSATGNSLDLEDGNLPACVNTWRGNTFVTDNEGGRPSALGRAASARWRRGAAGRRCPARVRQRYNRLNSLEK